MKPVRYAWLSVVLLAAGCRTPAPVAASSDESIWTARAAQIQVGMRRAEVEKILQQPPEIGFGPMTIFTGGMQAVNYRVSSDWIIVVAYDYTGLQRGPQGEVLKIDSPDNRVVSPPEMHRATGKLPDLPVVVQTPPDRATLIECVNRIQVGMRREEVEGILEFGYLAAGYNATTTRTGSSQGVVYRVAPGYRVVVFYDYTGGSNHPDNRVRHPARLESATD